MRTWRLRNGDWKRILGDDKLGLEIQNFFINVQNTFVERAGESFEFAREIIGPEKKDPLEFCRKKIDNSLLFINEICKSILNLVC